MEAYCFFGIVGVAALTVGCIISSMKTGSEERSYAVSRVYFASDRNLTESKKPAAMFGSNRGPIVVTGIETIDATATDTSLLGHSYSSEARSVLADIFYLIRDG